jgi:isochorismate synthase
MEKDIKEISLTLSKISEPGILNNFFHNALNLKKSVALWKLPSSEEKNIIVDFSDKLQKNKLNLHESAPGFAVSPFLNPENKETLFIKAHLHYNTKSKSLNFHNSYKNENAVSEFLDRLIDPEIKNLSEHPDTPSLNVKETSKAGYIETVKAALKEINENKFKKVVLARQKEISLSKNFNPVAVFEEICKEHFNSFVSLIYLPNTGTWIGASPELLVSIDKENVFRTTALAGTQKVNKDEEISRAVWTQKEIEEQAFVSRYIINCFKTIRLREFDEDGPRTVKAGNLIHLKTDFSVNINEVNFPELGTAMLDLLHPTSAVCGLPKENAMDFIRQHEEIDRKLYSGFLGPVNIDHESHIFVNIRCAEIGKTNAIVYGGAGITSESDPEKEFEETEMKMKVVMMNFE